ncbi:heme peroxidase [Amylocystis lapponica]|nr:heme peroxidase [Amylocystis lapponica]
MPQQGLIASILSALLLLFLRVLSRAPLPKPLLEHVLDRVRRASDLITNSAAPVDQLGARSLPSAFSQSVQDFEQTVLRGHAFSLSDLPPLIDAVKNLNGLGVDDRKFLLEKLVTLMSRLPDHSGLAQKLQQFFIDILYKDLPHPPSGYLSLPSPVVPPTSQTARAAKYAFRSADGSGYSIITPWLGSAGTPYARSVPSTVSLSPSELPDPALVFDTLLKRDQFVQHPGGISSLFFAFADLIIHSIFNTNTRDPTINDASSYLDLSPLYGSSQEQVDAVRRKDGTGRLWDDVFADNRLLFMPPSVCALLVLFCRNHNYVATQILRINERRTYVAPETLSESARTAQDDELFHRARLVNTAFFMQAILGDYVGAILGLVRDGLSWRLNPLETMRELDHEFAPQGAGNVVSLEFNLLYRWHATVSVVDTEWLEGLFGKLFDTTDFSKITVDDFRQALYKYVINVPGDVKSWTFNNLERGPGGRYKDDDLANILHNATEWSASAFKARGIPEVMRVVEIIGITQARGWGTCSLNEFRTFMGLKPYATFKEWNPDPTIYTAAESLYHDIDNLELHVGLQAEEAKTPMPGAGLCPGYTISRAILADAVCLTRGDRFLTVDFTPFNLTAWGYQDCMVDTQDGSYGGMLTKLLFRTLPRHYPAGSAYAHFPLMVPSTMRQYLAKLPDSPVDEYTWSRPVPPVANGTTAPGELYEEHLKTILKGVVPARLPVQRVIFANVEVPRWADAFGKITQHLLHSKAVEHVGSSTRYINIVRDVASLVPVYWLANDIVGLSLKTPENPRGEIREHELVEICQDIANYVFVNRSPVNDFTLRSRAKKTTSEIVHIIKDHLARINSSVLTPEYLFDAVAHWQGLRNENEHNTRVLKAVLAAARGQSHTELAAGLFAEVVATAALYSATLVSVIDYLLDGDAHTRIVRAVEAGSESDIVGLVREALQNNLPVAGKGHRASEESKSLALEHDGMLTREFFEKTATQAIYHIFSLQHVQRAPGQSGQLNRFTEDIDGVMCSFYSDVNGHVTPWPVSMVMQYNV